MAGRPGNPFPPTREGHFVMPVDISVDPAEEMVRAMCEAAERRTCKLDDCRWCERGMHHPNIFAVYDSREGTYVKAEDRACAARWATGTYGARLEGEICGRDGYKSLGDAWLCVHHFRRALDDIQEQEREERKRLDAEADARRERFELAREARLNPLVYFVERDGFCKIGYTTALDKRIKALSKGSCFIEGMTVGPVRLLATIPDRGLPTEGWMHRRFDHLRVGGEWFLLDDELREFIGQLKDCVAGELKAAS